MQANRKPFGVLPASFVPLTVSYKSLINLILKGTLQAEKNNEYILKITRFQLGRYVQGKIETHNNYINLQQIVLAVVPAAVPSCPPQNPS